MKPILCFACLLLLALAGCQSNPTRYEKLGLGELVTEVLALKTPYKGYPQESATPFIFEKFPLGSAKQKIAQALDEAYQNNRYAVLPEGLRDEKTFGVYIFHFRADKDGKFSREGLRVSFDFDKDDRLTDIKCVGSTFM